jgi:hypothetical protein
MVELIGSCVERLQDDDMRVELHVHCCMFIPFLCAQTFRISNYTQPFQSKCPITWFRLAYMMRHTMLLVLG